MSVAQAQARFARVPFATFLGMTLVDVTHARAVLALPFQPAHANAAGPLNGGASAVAHGRHRSGLDGRRS